MLGARSLELDAVESALRAAKDPEDRARLAVQVRHLQAYIFSRANRNCRHIPVYPCMLVPPDDPNKPPFDARSVRLRAEDHLADLCAGVFGRLPPGSALRVWELYNEVREECTILDPPPDPVADRIGLTEASGAYARAWLEGIVVADGRFQLGRVDYTVEIGSRQLPARAALVRLRSDDPEWFHASGSRINGTVELLDVPGLAELPVTSRNAGANH